MNPSTLLGFLDSKPLYYKEIDHLRIHQAYALLENHIAHPPTIHIVGTNGKGSTGRTIAHLAYEGGLSVGHYSSPHIMRFNERIWMNGEECSDEVLQIAHTRLYGILGEEMSGALSYFEYTTLLALVVFERCSLIVLEAGLGGEYDATNVSPKVLSIITPIGYDHQAFLGDTIEEIATTKIRSIDTRAIIAPQIYDEVIPIAQEIAKAKNATLTIVDPKFYPHQLFIDISIKKGWSDYLIENVTTALRALDILDIPYDIYDLESLELFGRFYSLTPNIRIDVGHNPLAAKAIAKALHTPTVLIYNSLDDKNYHEILTILAPKLKRLEIIHIENQRAATTEAIINAAKACGIPHTLFEGNLRRDEEYLVFGSFYVVEAFLKGWEHRRIVEVAKSDTN
jgi:dihydrofolate synthase / folylpolyglutamate synthase